MKIKKSSKLSEIRLDEIELEDGSEVHYVSFSFPESVGILPLSTDNEILLVRQYRYTLREFSWEIPAGRVNEGETPLDAVMRELHEETGYTSKKITPLLVFYPSSAMSNEKIYLFVATGLQSLVKLEKSELLERNIELSYFPYEKVLNMIRIGDITDACTLIAIYSHLNNI